MSYNWLIQTYTVILSLNLRSKVDRVIRKLLKKFTVAKLYSENIALYFSTQSVVLNTTHRCVKKKFSNCPTVKLKVRCGTLSYEAETGHGQLLLLSLTTVTLRSFTYLSLVVDLNLSTSHIHQGVTGHI